MASVLDALRVRITQRSLNAIDTVAAAARAAARDERYDIHALETAIDQAGMTMPEFEHAIATARRRLAWIADFEKLAVASGKVAKLEASAKAEQAKFEAARVAFLERANALDAQLDLQRAVRDRARDARDQLLDPKHVPGMVGRRYREAVEAAEAADQRAAEARTELRKRTEKVKYEEEWIAQLLNEQAGRVRPAQIFMKGDPVPEGESYRLQEQRAALARAQRREAEAKTQLAEAENIAAVARQAVEQLIPEVLKA